LDKPLQSPAPDTGQLQAPDLLKNAGKQLLKARENPLAQH
jgi:hypothetical protein